MSNQKKKGKSPAGKSRKKTSEDSDMSPFEDSFATSTDKSKQSAEKALEKAQDIIYEAWETGDLKKAVKLAKKALFISPDCADAYVFLANKSIENIDKAVEMYRQGVEAGRRALGEECFKEYKGEFWGLLETRPFMRAMEGLASSYYYNGKYREAAECLREMLELNPDDNQGVRYSLAGSLLMLEEYDELEKLLKTYQLDTSANWEYTKALLLFAKEGDSKKARGQLQKAIEANSHVPRFILDSDSLPADLPPYYSLGDESEAAYYYVDFKECWDNLTGAVEWLSEVSGIEKPEVDIKDDGFVLEQELNQELKRRFNEILRKHKCLNNADDVMTMIRSSKQVGNIPPTSEVVNQIFAPDEVPVWDNEEEAKMFFQSFMILWNEAVNTEKLGEEEALDLLFSPLEDITSEMMSEPLRCAKAVMSRHNRVLLFLRYLDGKMMKPDGLPPNAMTQLGYYDNLMETTAHMLKKKAKKLISSEIRHILNQIVQADSIIYMLFKSVLSGEDVPDAPFASGKDYIKSYREWKLDNL